MEIIVNEWLLEYLRPNAQESDKSAAIQFVNAWVRKCDKIVVKKNSPFVKKFHSFMKQFGCDTSFKKRFSKLHRLLFLNPDKTIIADDTDLKGLPQEIAAKAPVDDIYLIELWYSNQERIILTTDARLKEKLNDVPDLNIRLLEEFLQEYLA